MRRLTIIVVFVFLFTAVFSSLYRLYSKKFYDATGRAQWIWPRHQISREIPVAFFAGRDFDLPKWRLYTRIKVIGDPEYTLYFNGREIGGRRVHDDRHLDTYDVSSLARDAQNRIVVAVRSHNGVGGLITSVDITPEAENVVSTGRDWKIFRRWSDALPVRDDGPSEAPMVIGEPPAGRWNFLLPRNAEIAKRPERVVAPTESFPFRAKLGKVRNLQGIWVAGVEPVRAIVYDFGPIAGRVRLTLTGRSSTPPLINVHLAATLEELKEIEYNPRPFVFAAGETSVTDPEVMQFRYVVVYGVRARAEVVR